MGGYDLHGNYYKNSRDAWNAEEAQVAAIDARYADQRSRQVQRDLQRNEQLYSQYLEEFGQRIRYLEQPLRRYVDIQEQQNNKQ